VNLPTQKNKKQASWISVFFIWKLEIYIHTKIHVPEDSSLCKSCWLDCICQLLQANAESTKRRAEVRE
jgi:hypothetical protein